MNYEETLHYLFSRLPMYQRVGAAAYKADLDNTLRLCALLDHPESEFKSIHVAGTNGKGSTSHMLAAILQSAGYKTGLYTSPHLKDFRERIRINGEMIREEEVIRFVAAHKSDFEKIDLSFFEWTVGLCFSYFASEQVDLAVIETGLGGRLDSTNVITPELSIITNISYDHTNLLGDTLEQIASEKAGIIKSGVPVIIGERQEATAQIFVAKAADCGSELTFASDINKVTVKAESIRGLVLDVSTAGGSYTDLEVDLSGTYQQKNISTVLESVRRLQDDGWKISKENIYDGLRQVKRLTGLRGRWQVIHESPLTICDVGHNEAGIREIVRQISLQAFRKLRFVLGVVNDKDITSMLSQLPAEAIYYFCKASIPRAMDAEELRKLALEFNLSGLSYPSVGAALKAARHAAAADDLVFVGGSTFVVAEVI